MTLFLIGLACFMLGGLVGVFLMALMTMANGEDGDSRGQRIYTRTDLERFGDSP